VTKPTDGSGDAPPSVEVSGEIGEPAEMTTGTIAGDPTAPPAEALPAEGLPYPSPPTHVPGEPASTLSAAQAVQPAAPDDSLLPATADLHEAVGAPTRKRRREPEAAPDDDLPRPRSRRVQVIAALSLVGGLGIVTLIFLGRANSERYLLTCSTDRVTPEQGRAFPPWGSRPMIGPEWKPIALPPNAECTERETDDIAQLEKLYLDVLLDRASTTLTGKALLDKPAGSGAQAPLDVVSAELTQALLLARPAERRDQRKEIERLMGDVTYWRATARLRDAAIALADAAKQFETAAAQRPRHVSDADAWAQFTRHVIDELHAGPGGAPAPIAPTSSAPVETHAPMGSALPVEPPASEAPPTVDAGIPSGGVLPRP
jgi:hypothetical protein